MNCNVLFQDDLFIKQNNVYIQNTNYVKKRRIIFSRTSFPVWRLGTFMALFF